MIRLLREFLLSLKEQNENKQEREMLGQAIDRNPHARRLVIELSSVYVACDDCGHTSVMSMPTLLRASKRGVQTYADLCKRFRCAECPPRARDARNLTIRPKWVEPGQFQTVA